MSASGPPHWCPFDEAIAASERSWTRRDRLSMQTLNMAFSSALAAALLRSTRCFRLLRPILPTTPTSASAAAHYP